MILTTRLHKYMLCCLVLYSLIITTSPAWGQQVSATPNQDFIIVLDQSGSMREKVPGEPGQGYYDNPLESEKALGAVNALNEIADNILKDGDNFSLITFGNDAELILSQELHYPHERELLAKRVRAVPFRDKYTDIIVGLQKAGDLLTKLRPERRKILVLITDGRNEPPDDSPYKDPQKQQEAYDGLRELFDSNSWDVALVGLGAHTNITEIAQKLNLPEHYAIVVDDVEDNQQITQRLRTFAEEVESGQVNLEVKVLQATLEPKLFGGYKEGTASLLLTSTYKETTVTIQLDPNTPIQLQGNTLANVTVQPLSFTLNPQQSEPINFIFTVAGKRPFDGRVKGLFTLQFADKKTKVFPASGEFDIYLQSWWEAYGVYAVILIILGVAALIVATWLIRKSMVPEIKFVVSRNGTELGNAVTLKTRKGTFKIGKGAFEPNVFSVKELTCNTAVTGKYLGRRRFQLSAVEAKILNEDDKEFDSLLIGMDTSFGLKDSSGKVLRGFSITAPGSGGDPFGSGSSSDDFF